jgi:hypothetical protein
MQDSTDLDKTTAGMRRADQPDESRALASKLVADLDLVATIRSWNADQYALIATVEHVRSSVIYDEARLRAFDAAEDEALERGFSSDFRTWLAVLLDPILVSTTLAGVASRCRDWAVECLAQGPAADQATAPFPSDDAMAEWMLRHMEPPILAGPTGERIMEPAVERSLLTQALRAELRLAVEEGWLDH